MWLSKRLFCVTWSAAIIASSWQGPALAGPAPTPDRYGLCTKHDPEELKHEKQS